MLGLADELEKIESGEARSSLENLLYFAARPYFADAGPSSRIASGVPPRRRERGVYHIDPRSAVDVGVQVIDLSQARPRPRFDPRLCDPGTETLDPRATDAIIVNINYPLGFAAYHILSQVAMATEQIRGIYILGKAATLNGRIGDVMIANVVFDEHSGNTYWFDNCFSYAGPRAVPRSTAPRSTTRRRSPSRAPTCRTRATSTSTTARISPSSKWKPAHT